MSGLLSFFARGAEAPSITDQAEIDRLYRRHRFRVMVAITLGYGLIYTCRLALGVVKKPLIDQGIFTPVELGSIGSALFYRSEEHTSELQSLMRIPYSVLC